MDLVALLVRKKVTHGRIGAPEMIIILLILVLLFGAQKLPELARGSGRALRIFKAETKGLVRRRRRVDEDRRTAPDRGAAHTEPGQPGRGCRAARGATPSADPEDRTDVAIASGVRLFRVKPQHPSAPTAGWRSRTTFVSSGHGS